VTSVSNSVRWKWRENPAKFGQIAESWTSEREIFGDCKNPTEGGVGSPKVYICRAGVAASVHIIYGPIGSFSPLGKSREFGDFSRFLAQKF
jgi:hypothetical protein